MNLKNKNILYGLTGSFCNFKSTILEMKELVKENAKIIPIMSYTAYNLDTKFGVAKDYIKKIEELTGNEVIYTIKDSKQLDYNNVIDIMIIAPCTGNTLAKLSNGICDSPILMAAKINLIKNNPIVIGISASDGLSTNAENIGRLFNKKNYFFIPFRQINSLTKPHSLGFAPKYIKKTLEYALEKEQIQPILL